MSKLRHPDRPDELETQNARMIQLIEGLVNENGKSPSSLQGVSLMRSDCAMLRKPVMYEPSIVIIAQGRKRGYLGGETFVYDQNNYLVLSVPLPFECDTEGTPEKPLLGLSINVDVPMLAELMLKTEPKKLQQENPAASQSIYCTKLDTKLADATNRLLETLYDKNEASILGHSIKREIVYRVLCGEQGSSLRSIATLDSRSSLINRALLRIHTEYGSKGLDVSTLADDIGMSNSAFHHNFKEVTATSPVQYLKSVRLHKARQLMLQDGINAGAAANMVGYESQSQFSREFKRFFGASPSEEVARSRAHLATASELLGA